MKRLIKSLLCLLIIFTSLNIMHNNNVLPVVTEVLAYGDFSYGARHIGEWNGTWISELLIDGQLVFCLEPNVLTPQNPADYPGYSEDYSALSWEEQYRVGRWAYAHSIGMVSYVDAQIGIWEGREAPEVGANVPNLQPKENFDLIIGKEVRYTDSNGVMASKGYNVSNCGAGLECRIEGNDLVLKGVAKADNTSATVSPNDAGGFWAVAWKKQGFQTVATAGGTDPSAPATVSGRVRSREIHIVKRNEYGAIVSEPHSFEVATDDEFTNVIKTITTDANGFATTGTLDNNGTYYIREKETAWGYECNKQVLVAEVNDNIVVLDSLTGNGITNNSRNFKLTITKKDIENPEIILDNSEFDIYDVTGGIREKIAHIKTGEQGNIGTYTYDKAKYKRTYEICEVVAPVGFELDKNPCKQVTMDIKEGEEEKKVDFENEKSVKEASVSLRKIDSEYDEIKINGVEFTLYDVTDETNKKELEKVVTGNQYIKVYNPYNPLEVLSNKEIIFYEDEQLTKEVVRVNTDNAGLIAVSSIKELEKGKEYYYKQPAVTVSFNTYDINSRIRVTPNTEVTIYSDEALTQEVVKLTSDNDGWLNVGVKELEKSVEPKACKLVTNSTKDEEVVKEEKNIKYYYNLKLVGRPQKVSINKNQNGYANFTIQSGKKYEICESRLPENYTLPLTDTGCRVIDYMDKNTNLDFKKEIFLNDRYKVKLHLIKRDADNNETVLNNAKFTIRDISYKDTNFNNVIKYDESYQLGQVVEIDDMKFVVYEKADNNIKVVNVRNRERLELTPNFTKNLTRDDIDLGEAVTGSYMIYDKRYDTTYNWSELKVGDKIYDRNIIEVIEKEIYRLHDGTIAFKEKNGKVAMENTEINVYRDKGLTQHFRTLHTDKDGKALLFTNINEWGTYYIKNEATQEVREISTENGVINIDNVRQGNKLLVCEIESPAGYLIGDACNVIEMSNQDKDMRVVNYKPNRRKRRVLELRKMGDFTINNETDDFLIE